MKEERRDTKQENNKQPPTTTYIMIHTQPVQGGRKGRPGESSSKSDLVVLLSPFEPPAARCKKRIFFNHPSFNTDVIIVAPSQHLTLMAATSKKKTITELE
mmetsp:Transcript_21645/g.37862  ORF Transcript_21645/g.37862 Transcript_21645/m.37862 type:complete len:101 (-) Transcript_21645:198-500(-)